MLTYYTGRRFIVVKTKISKIRGIHFYLTFGFLRLRMLRNEQWIFSEVVKILEFWIWSGWIEKYKPALSKSDSSCDNPYCVRLVIFWLAVNIGKLQSLFSVDNFFCWVSNDSCSNFLLYNFIDFVRMYKSVVESCVDKKLSDRLSSFDRCWSSLLRLLMALRRSVLRIYKASLLETFGSLKIRNFGYTPSCFPLLRKFIQFIVFVL